VVAFWLLLFLRIVRPPALSAATFHRMHTLLVSMAPESEADHVRALAALWTDEVDRVVSGMLALARDSVGPVLPEECRHAALRELAELQLWLEQRIVERKLAGCRLDEIDPEAEAAWAGSPEASECIENTATICANGIWIPLVREWRRRYPFIDDQRARPTKLVPRRVSAPGSRRHHYSPRFANRRWANEDGLLRVYRRGVDHLLTFRDVGYGSWAWEPFLYSQGLERYFGLVEGDAAGPYRKLLTAEPLSEQDRRCWVAFLTVQLFRTPSMIVRNLAGLRALIRRRELDFPTDVASLRLAHETLFTNNDLFAHLYRMLCRREWRLLSPPPGKHFVRGDNPAVVVGSESNGNWRLVYPLSPDRCFVAGPGTTSSTTPPDFAIPVAVDDAEVSRLNHCIAAESRLTVIGPAVPDDSWVRGVLEFALPVVPAPDRWADDLSFSYWSPPRGRSAAS